MMWIQSYCEMYEYEALKSTMMNNNYGPIPLLTKMVIRKNKNFTTHFFIEHNRHGALHYPPIFFQKNTKLSYIYLD